MLDMRGNKITWLGHATFKITIPSGAVILIDPWVGTNPKCPEALRSFDRVDFILATHGHSDHITDVVALARKHDSQVAAVYETALWFQSQGVKNIAPMGKGGTQKLGQIEVTLVQALHSNGIEDGGKIVYGGEAAGFIVRLPGGLVIYHAGDTAVFGDMKLLAELYAPELALLPIGDLYTMGPREAAHAIRLLSVRHVVPMHYGTFPQLTGTPAALRHLTQDIPDLEIHALEPGETLS